MPDVITWENSMIDSAAFLMAFSDEWHSRVVRERHELIGAYADKKEWTDYMLGDDGVLAGVVKRLALFDAGLGMVREWYTFDALFVGSESLYKDKPEHPSKVYVAIEHEQGEDPEVEMWKLLHWRSPLKVLFIYDWNEDRKSTEMRRAWISTRLAEYGGMIQTVEAHCSEPQSSYLVLVGGRASDAAVPEWKWWCKKGSQPAAQSAAALCPLHAAR